MNKHESAIGLPLLAAALPLLAWAAPAGALDAELRRVTSVPFSSGGGGEAPSRLLDMTPDGRLLLILSQATNLLAGFPDTNGKGDLLVYDREAVAPEWITISVLDPLQPALSSVHDGVISADGRFVAFSSEGRRHAPGTQGYEIRHVYLFDRQTRGTVKVSHPAGNPLGHGNGVSSGPLLSADGRYLAYQTRATNLTGGADGNNGLDVFHYDRATGVSTLVSHSYAAPGNAASAPSNLSGLSADGRFVLLQSSAVNLVKGFVTNASGQQSLYVWDRDSNSSVLASHMPGSPLAGANSGILSSLLAADGSKAAFGTHATNLVAGFTDNNGSNEPDVYVWERATGSVQLVSSSPTQTLSRGSSLGNLSADGTYLFFYSKATDAIPGLVRPADDDDGLFRYHTGTRAIELINHKAGQPAAVALGGARRARIAPDGGALLFVNSGSEMVPGQIAGENQLFAYHLATGAARLLSHVEGQPLVGTEGELPLALSADHRYAAFTSSSSQVVSGDRNNGNYDAFLYDLDLAAPRRLSTSASSGLASSQGNFIPFSTVPGEVIESIPAAGLYLFHAQNVTPLLPGIIDRGGFDPVLYDPRSGSLTALVAPGGATPDGDSRATFLADGLGFLLRSTGSGLVPGMTDGNGAGADLYAGNRTRGGLELISSSAASASTSGNRPIGGGLVASASGRFVAYDTLATNAVAGTSDANGAEDVILHDRQLGTRVLVSRAAGTMAAANARSHPLAMSADGELLLIASNASDLIPGFTDLNGATGTDLFLYRRGSESLTLVSHAAGSTTHSGDAYTPSGQLSADGRFVFFANNARNLVPGMIDRNGNASDVFVYATATGAISLASHVPGDALRGADGGVGLVQISADGRFALLSSRAKDLIGPAGVFPTLASNTFVHDRVSDRTTLISHLPGQPFSSLVFIAGPMTMTADGRFVAFQTEAPNVLPGQQDEALRYSLNLYLTDRATGGRTLLSRSLSGPRITGNGHSDFLKLRPDGKEAFFISQSTNLSFHHSGPNFEVFFADLASGDGELFSDGFELGDSSLWSQTHGSP